jgi:AcrR family transcriptional regulator
MAYSEKQIQIIEAAEQLFATHGYGNTSVRQIADKAGVNLAMISYYFGSKEKLMYALVELRTCHVRITLENLQKDDSLTPLQKVNMMVSEYVERFAQRQYFYKIMVTEHMLDKNNEITQMLIETKHKNAEVLVQIIKEGQKKKVFKKNIDIVMLMNVMVGTVNHSLLNKAFYKEFHQLQKMKEEEFNNFLLKKVTDEIKTIFKALLIYEA